MTGLGYTAAGRAAVIVVCALELAMLRTGLFRRPAYWLSMLIVLGFQIPVDGWLTKLSCPDRGLRPAADPGVRIPFDIPIEDFLFGFAMATAVLLLWERQHGRRMRARLASRRACRDAFDTAAAAYDRLVGANPGYHADLRLSARRMRNPVTWPGLATARRRMRHRRVDCRTARRRTRSRRHRGRRVTRECSTWRSPRTGLPQCDSCTRP